MTRDMTRAQFRAALARNGFRQVLLWTEDTTGTGISFGAILNGKTGKMCRRETVAHAITQRAAVLKGRAAAEEVERN